RSSTTSAPMRWALFRAAERMVRASPLATASRKPKSAASTATPLASCAARKRISCSANAPPERSCSAARASTVWRVLTSTAASVPAATLIISVQSPDGHALAGAVVTARPLDAPGKRLGPVHAVMDQVDRAFAPDLLVIPVGSTVEFPNSDSVSHQIYSFSPTKRFKLPLYRGKPYPPVPFDQAGVVTLGCNIHDDMLAYLVVTDAPWFGRTDKS